MASFLETLRDGVIVADGGMGSMLHQLATKRFPCPDALTLSEPDVVIQIHGMFLRAGARLIETNTFGANRAKLEAFGLADEVRAINGRAVKLAREAREIAGVDAFVGGSIGPTGWRIQRSPGQAALLEETFQDQALHLEDRGVDLFVCETFLDPWELARAVAGVRRVSSLPVVAQLTLPAGDDWLEEGEEEDLDLDTRRRLRELRSIEADVLGLNCTLGPDAILPALRRLAARLPGVPLAVQPNSGLPRREGGRFLYPRSEPAYWARFAKLAAEAGARVVGGCCGTGPVEIAAIAGALTDWRPTAHRATAPPSAAPPPEITEDRPVSTLRQRLDAGEFVVSMQVDPPKGTQVGMVLEACRAFRDSGHVHCVDVNSNPMARLHMDALWMSAAIEREGVETIAHYTPRDASLMGIEGNLLGAWTQGVRNVLVITGDPSVVRGEPGASDVYQTDAVGLVRQLSQLNEGIDCFGNAIGGAPNFTLGVAVNPNAEDLDREIDRYKAKIDAGAHFAMTQVFFEWSCWERFLDRLGGHSPIPVLAAVWPLTSHRLALRLHHEVPGIILPDALLQRLEDAGRDARKVGFDHARGMLEASRARVQGVYVIAPFKRPRNALELFGG